MIPRQPLTEEQMQRPYGRLTILADEGRTVPVRCECGVVTRKQKYQVISGGVRSCGNDCALGRVPRGHRGPMSDREKHKRRVGSTRAHKDKRDFLSADLDAAEREQVRRIIESRTGEARHARETRREAIDLVIRDRKVGEMVCHGGTVETL